MKQIYIIFLLLILLVPIEVYGKESGKDFTVVIDAGHGGKDIGATDNGVMEKNINLEVAKQLRNLIKKKMKDAKVVMTRDDDTYLTLQQRADVANGAKGDIFISIHTNSVDKKNKNRRTVAGSSVYALGLHKDDNNMQVAQRENSVIELESDYEQKYSGFDPMKDESYIIFEMAQKKNLSQSIRLAEDIEKELVASGREDRGVHQAGFWVLWATSMPAVLVELDFICNPESATYLSSEKGSKELAGAIFNAVEKYYKGWKKNMELISSSSSGVKDIDSSNEFAESTVEEVASIYAVATTRKRKVVNSPETNNLKTQVVSNDNYQRKRRSKTGRELAKSIDYETDKIIVSKEEVFVATENVTPKAESEQKVEQKDVKKKNTKHEKPSKKEKKEKKENRHNAKRGKLTTVYKIQILASEDLLKENNPRFCGLSPISTYKENDLYKYFFGESTEKEEMERLLVTVKNKIPDAFIVSTTKSVK